MKLLLSLCILTYNRKEKLKRLIESILNQAEKFQSKIEICVSDNASSDGTREYLKKIEKNSMVSIRTLFSDKNAGFDANVIKALELGRGRWLWLMGDDDYVLNGSLTKVIEYLEKIERDKNIVLTYLTAPGDKPREQIDNITSEELVKKPNGFLSNNIIRRKAFDNLDKSMIRNGIGTYYAHSWIIRLIGMGEQNGKATYFPPSIMSGDKSATGVTLARQLKFDGAAFYTYSKLSLYAIGHRHLEYFLFFSKKTLLALFFIFFEITCNRAFRPSSKETIGFLLFLRFLSIFSMGFWIYYKLINIMPFKIAKIILIIGLRIIGTLGLSKESDYQYWKRFWSQ